MAETDFIQQYNRVKGNIEDAYDTLEERWDIIKTTKNSAGLTAAINEIPDGTVINNGIVKTMKVKEGETVAVGDFVSYANDMEMLDPVSISTTQSGTIQTIQTVSLDNAAISFYNYDSGYIMAKILKDNNEHIIDTTIAETQVYYDSSVSNRKTFFKVEKISNTKILIIIATQTANASSTYNLYGGVIIYDDTTGTLTIPTYTKITDVTLTVTYTNMASKNQISLLLDTINNQFTLVGVNGYIGLYSISNENIITKLDEQILGTKTITKYDLNNLENNTPAQLSGYNFTQNYAIDLFQLNNEDILVYGVEFDEATGSNATRSKDNFYQSLNTTQNSKNYDVINDVFQTYIFNIRNNKIYLIPNSFSVFGITTTNPLYTEYQNEKKTYIPQISIDEIFNRGYEIKMRSTGANVEAGSYTNSNYHFYNENPDNYYEKTMSIWDFILNHDYSYNTANTDYDTNKNIWKNTKNKDNIILKQNGAYPNISIEYNNNQINYIDRFLRYNSNIADYQYEAVYLSELNKILFIFQQGSSLSNFYILEIQNVDTGIQSSDLTKAIGIAKEKMQQNRNINITIPNIENNKKDMCFITVKYISIMENSEREEQFDEDKFIYEKGENYTIERKTTSDFYTFLPDKTIGDLSGIINQNLEIIFYYSAPEYNSLRDFYIRWYYNNSTLIVDYSLTQPTEAEFSDTTLLGFCTRTLGEVEDYGLGTGNYIVSTDKVWALPQNSTDTSSYDRCAYLYANQSQLSDGQGRLASISTYS